MRFAGRFSGEEAKDKVPLAKGRRAGDRQINLTIPSRTWPQKRQGEDDKPLFRVPKETR